HRPVVPGLAGADEVVVGDVERRPRLAEALGGTVGPGTGGHPVGLGGALNFESMLVGAGEEERLVTQQAVPAGDGVGHDRGVGVADVRGVVDVVDGGRHVEAGHDGSGYCRPRTTHPARRRAFRGAVRLRWTPRAQAWIVLPDRSVGTPAGPRRLR